MYRNVVVTVCAVLIALAIGISGSTAPSQQRLRFGAAVSQDGWWMRVKMPDTKATEINFQLGTNPKNVTANESWRPGPVNEIVFPAALQQETVIHVHATAEPGGRVAAVCVFFQTQGVEALDFTGSVDRQINAKSKAPQCVP